MNTRTIPRNLLLGVTALVLVLVACSSSSGSSTPNECPTLQQLHDATTKKDVAAAKLKKAKGKLVIDNAKKAANDAGLAYFEMSVAYHNEGSNPACAKGNKKAQVKNRDGSTDYLPVIDSGAPVVADATLDSRTPSSVREEKKNGPLKSWEDAYKRLGKYDYYVNGVNERAAKTGFGWGDVQHFAGTNVDARRITVISWPGKTDQQAREDVRGLIGKDADVLPIVRINPPGNCLVNTRGFEDGPGMEDFCDRRPMVRVALLPIVYDLHGKAIGVSDKSGIFIDCFNLFRVPVQVVVIVIPPTTSGTTPPGVTTSTKPKTSWQCQQNWTPGCPNNPASTPSPGSDPGRTH